MTVISAAKNKWFRTKKQIPPPPHRHPHPHTQPTSACGFALRRPHHRPSLSVSITNASLIHSSNETKVNCCSHPRESFWRGGMFKGGGWEGGGRHVCLRVSLLEIDTTGNRSIFLTHLSYENYLYKKYDTSHHYREKCNFVFNKLLFIQAYRVVRGSVRWREGGMVMGKGRRRERGIDGFLIICFIWRSENRVSGPYLALNLVTRNSKNRWNN